MNINQLLNPASTPSPSRPPATLRSPDHHLEYHHESRSTGSGSNHIHRLAANHVVQDTRMSGSEALGAKCYLRNPGLMSSVTEPATQSYGVAPTYMTHGHTPILTTPPYPSDPVRFQYVSPTTFRYDISSQLPIERISLHNRGLSCGLTMASTSRSEFGLDNLSASFPTKIY